MPFSTMHYCMSSIAKAVSIIFCSCHCLACITLLTFHLHRDVYPPCLQILRIDGGGMINDIIMHTPHDVICKKTREKDVVGIVTFDLIGLLCTNNIIAYITMAYRGL